jgi:hypothetical protein
MATAAEQLSFLINSQGAVNVTNTTTAVSTNSGALTVSGGIGIGGNLFVGGTITATTFVGSFSGAVTGSATSVANSLIAGTGLTSSGGGFNGASAVTFSLNTATLMATAVNLASGTAGQLAYQSAANTTGFVGPGTYGQFLMSTGAGAPVYQSTLTQTNGNIVITGNLGVGNVASANILGNLHISTDASANVYFDRYGNAPPNMIFRRANGTLAAPTNLVLDNQIFALGARGYGATGFSSGGRAAVYAAASETWSDTSQGAYLAFNTTPNGTATAATVLRLENTGQVNIQTTTATNSTATGALIVAGGVGVAGGVYAGGAVTATSFAGSSITISGASAFQGPVTFSGTATYISSTNTIYTDNIIELHSPNAGVYTPWFVDDGKDIGFRFHYYTNSTDTNAALVLANDTKWLEWYSSGAESSSGTFAGSAYGNFKTGGVWATTGAGVGYTSSQIGEKFGVNGGAYVNGNITATNFTGNLTGNVTGNLTGNVTGTVTGSITGNAATVSTVQQTASASYYPTFVAANNASASASSVYTTSSFVINPATGFIGIGGSSTQKLTIVGGSIALDNAQYIYQKTSASTSTRIFGMNSANDVYIGSVDSVAGTMRFNFNGSDRMILDTNSRLGVGINSSLAATITANESGGGTIRATRSSVGSEYIQLEHDGTNGTITVSGANAMLFRTNSSERMRIDGSGNLLIGYTAAQSNGLLQVNGGIGLAANSTVRQATNSDGGTLKFYGTQFVSGQNNGGSYGYTGGAGIASVSPSASYVTLDVGGQATGNSHRLKVINDGTGITGYLYYGQEGGSTATLYANVASGNVGINTTSPSARLHVIGTESRFGGVASGYISVYNATGRSGYIQANGGTDLRIASDSDPMTFYVNGSERLRIDSSGRLGIGITNPSYQIHNYINGNSSLQLYNQNPSTGSSNYVSISAATNYNESVFRSYGSGFNTFAHAGISLANWTEIWAGTLSSTGPAGMLIGVDSSAPIVFATNNTERVRIDANGNLLPGANAAQDLGSTSTAWRNVYTNDLHLSNMGHEEGNLVDGTRGNWTVQEGAEDLYLINNLTGKKYRFKLEELS